MKRYEALEVLDDQGQGLGHYRIHAGVDLDELDDQGEPAPMQPLCTCLDHTTTDAARKCLGARLVIAAEVLAPEIELRGCAACGQLYNALLPHVCVKWPKLEG